MSIISKSTFIRSCKCVKSLYLYKNHYDLKDNISDAQQAIFDQGYQIGELARRLFPKGEDASIEPRYDYFASINKTNKLIKDGVTVIYEAGFLFNGLYAAIDILVLKNNNAYIYEVKSTTTVKDYNIIDVAVQYYILNGLGYKVKNASAVYINNEYVRKGDIEPNKLFKSDSLINEAKDLQSFIAEQLLVANNILLKKEIPSIEIGTQCSKFYGCDYESYCWKAFDNVEYPVTSISRIGERLYDLIEKNILDIRNIPENFPLTANQHIQVSTIKNTSTIFNKKEVKQFLNHIEYPVYFFDFETIATAIPLFDNSRPYQQIPFQYSLHIKKNKTSVIEHFEFLGDGKNDPRKDLIEQLIVQIGKKGTILCYNKSFEIGRLNDLANAFPEYSEKILEIIVRIVDLIEPFRSKNVYHWQMNGSASIKSVLPAFIPELSYKDLEIQEGGSASQAYLNLLEKTNEVEIEKTRKALLKYCERDTIAMVELLNFLEREVEK